MKKNVKVLSGALAASLTMGAMPVFAADMSADELYKAAFEAVLAAQKARTQESINTARTAIKALAGTDAEFAVGEFSKQVDGVQQELFEGFLAALDKAQKSNKQADINAARTYVEMFRTCPDTLVYVEGGWSQVVDLVQQKLIDKAEAAVRKAQETRLQADVDAAKALLEELATSTNKDVTAWVTAIETELEAVKVINLEVTKVNAIETTIVEVAFDALTEAKADVTIEVKDSEGVVREVVAQDLAKGATFAQFDFATVVKADDLKGVWTVNGQAYSFTELKLVQDIVAEATANNQVKLFSLLTEAGIKNLNADYIVDYVNDIQGATTTPVWASDVQKIIDNTNKNKAEAKDEATVVKAVVDATTQIQLKAALEANFERVNADWIAQYALETVGGKAGMLTLDGANAGHYDVTVVEIQAAIDNANAGAIATANSGAKTSAEQAAVTVLIQNWVEADDPKTPNNTPKANAIAASKAKAAAFKVAEATTENSLYNALVAYANATEDSVLKSSELNVNLKSEYKAALDITGVQAALVTQIKTDHADVAAGVKAKIVTIADKAAVDKAIDSVGTTATAYDGAKTDATKKAAFEKALQKLADVTSHKTGDDKFDASKVDAELLEEYAATVKGFAASSNTVKEIQDAIGTANTNKELTKAVKVVADANSTATQVRDALTTLALSETGNATATAYVNASAQVKLEVAQFIVDNNDKLEDPLTKATIVADGNASYAANAIGKAMADHTAKVGEFNAIGALSAATTATTKDALDIYGHEGYKALTELQKLSVAEEINKLTKPTSATDATPIGLDFSGADKVTTLKAANDIINAAIAKVK